MARVTLTRVWRVGGGLLAGLLTGTAAVAEASQPYEAITARNIFRLRMPDLPPQVIPQVVPMPRIVLTGITTITGQKKALLKVEFSANGAQLGSERSMILAERQREGEIEAIVIDPLAGRVTLSVFGVKVTLTFENDRATTTTRSPSPRVTLVGVGTGGRARAILSVAPDTSELLASVKHNLVLHAGEQDGPSEVPAIEPNAAKVRISVNAEEKVLSF